MKFWEAALKTGAKVRSTLLAAAILCGTVGSGVAFSYPLSYGGRLAGASGDPLPGPLVLKLKFYREETGGTALSSVDLGSVPLVDGVFNVSFDIPGDQLGNLLGDGSEQLYVEVMAEGRSYPRQAYSFVPYALRVPVDNQTIVFNGAGELAIGTVTSLQGRPVLATPPQQNQVLTWDGSAWVPAALQVAPSVTVGAGLANNAGTLSIATVGTAGTFVKVTTNAQGQVVSGAALNAADIPSLDAAKITSGLIPLTHGGTGAADAASARTNLGLGTAATLDFGTGSGQLVRLDTVSGKLPAIDGSQLTNITGTDTTKLLKSGDTMAGALNMGGNAVSDVGGLALSAGRSLQLGAMDNDGETALIGAFTSTDKGKTWFNTTVNRMKYWDGTEAKALDFAGAGLASLNGLSTSSQTFAIGTSGTAPAFDSAASVHTLNLPAASSSGVTRGLISNTDYLLFAGKMSSITAGTGLSGGTITGDGTLSLAPVGSIGIYTKVTTNAQGQVVSGAALNAADIPDLDAAKISSGVFTTDRGGTGVTTASPQSVFAGPTVGPTAAAPTFRPLEAVDIPGLDTSKITTGTLDVLRGGTGAAIAAANKIFAGPDGVSGAPAFRSLTASDLPIGEIDSSLIKDGGILDADISSSAAISSAKINFLDRGISGDKIDGGTITRFTSTGITDNSKSRTLTIDSTGNIGIGSATPGQKLEVAGVIKSSAGGIMFPDGSLQTRAAMSPALITLADQPTITADASLGTMFQVTLGGDRTLAVPTNMQAGMVYAFKFVQDSVGGRALSFASGYRFPSGITQPRLSPDPGAEDVGQFLSDGTKLFYMAGWVTAVKFCNSPTDLTATAASGNQINLTWIDSNSFEGGYQIERSLDGMSGWSAIYTTPANISTYANTGLLDLTRYYYRVMATCGLAGNSPYSMVQNVTTPRAIPSNVTATTVSGSEISLSWDDNSSSEIGYEVARSIDNTTWVTLATAVAGATSYSSSGLNNGTRYYYKVRAKGTSADSEYSAVVDTTTTIAAPISLTATAASTTKIDLSWADNSTGESGFQIDRSADGSSWTTISTANANTTSYSDTGLTEATPYYYRIRANGATIDSSFTSTASATTVLLAPTSLTATATVVDTISLNWVDNSSVETGYEIARSIDGSTWTTVTTTTANATSYTNSGLSSSTTYLYRVRAVKSGVYSSYLATVSQTIGACGAMLQDSSQLKSGWRMCYINKSSGFGSTPCRNLLPSWAVNSNAVYGCWHGLGTMPSNATNNIYASACVDGVQNSTTIDAWSDSSTVLGVCIKLP